MARRSREEEMTLEQVRSEISRLESRAERLEHEGRKVAYFAKVKEGLDVLNLSMEDLLAGLAALERSTRPLRGKGSGKQRKPRTAAPTYGDGSGATWSGKGRAPQWFRDALNSGKRKEDLLLQGSSTHEAKPEDSVEAADPIKQATKRVAKATRAKFVAEAKKAKYADGNGNTWSGFGPKPKWLRDGIEAGRTLESFAAQ